MFTFAHHEAGCRWPEIAVRTRAVAQDGEWMLTGTKNPVLHGDCADRFVVTALLPNGGVGLFLVNTDTAGVTVAPYHTHDGLRGAQVELADARAVVLGEPADRAGVIELVEIGAQAALCAEAVGAMEETLRLTLDYLKAREQFGVPLATFQSLAHRSADMHVALESARSMSLYATMALADAVTDPQIASRAKLQVGRSARLIGQEAIQMHGGIGLTAEYPLSHYVARLTAIEHTMGSAQDHLRRLARHVGDHTMVGVVA